jgi:hypothetical protein
LGHNAAARANAGLLDDEIIAIDHALTRPCSTLESLDSHRVRGTAFGGAPPEAVPPRLLFAQTSC